MKAKSNKEKAKDILNCKHCTLGEKICFAPNETPCVSYRDIIKMAEWKDEQYKQDNSNFINYLKKWAQGWLIEQLTAFAVHLNKRGAFRDDLCMDFEHEAQSFIELQKPKKL